MAATQDTAIDPSIPEAPKHFPDSVKAQWQKKYSNALAQAKLDSPDNERAQRVAALKAANSMLAVPAPKSAADIDALEEWQVMRGTRRTVDGNRVCITSDGRKYGFPVPPPAAAKGSKSGDSGKTE